MRPTLSTPDAWAISITFAMSAKGILSSPFTNMTFSARVLKMSVNLPCKPSQVASSWLILRPGVCPGPLSMTWTTMVRSLLWFLGAFGRRLRHQRVQPFRRQWRNDHKNDQQHQQHVDHRGYVDLTSLAPAGADCHTHKKSPSEPIRFRWRRAPEADCWSASSDRLTAPDRPPLQHEHCPPRQLRICTSPARPPGGKRSYPYGWRFGL